MSSKMYKVVLKTRTERTKYYVGEKEKDYMVRVFEPLKDVDITVEEFNTESQESV